ncbi:MAG: hypothetical protein AAFX99_13715 [Myxococcota bacterium]
MTTTNKSLRRARVVTRRVTAGLIQHAAPAAETLDAELKAEGEEPLVQAEHMRRLAELTQKRFDRYAQGQSSLGQDERETTEARSARDSASGDLKTTLSQLGSVMRATYGQSSTIQANLSGSVPSVSENLLSFARAFLDATEGDYTLPEPTNPFATALDMASARVRIEALTTTLERTMGAVEAEVRDDQSARLKRDELFEAWEREVRFARDQARAMMVRAGQKELADRLLPTDNQILGVEPIDDPEEDEDPAVDGP